MTQASDVADFLLSRRLYLTALELHTELLETGEECKALSDYFAHGIDMQADDDGASSHSQSTTTMQEIDELYSRTGSDGRADDRLAVLEFELRQARETIESLREQLTHTVGGSAVQRTPSNAAATQQHSAVDSINNNNSAANGTPSSAADTTTTTTAAGGGGGGGGSGNGANSDGTDSELDTSPIREYEQRAINYLVNDYLLTRDYKLTAITLADEVPDQDVERWSDVGVDIELPPSLLNAYRLHWRGALGKNGVERDRREQSELRERIEELEEELAVTVSSRSTAERRLNRVLHDNEELERRLASKSREGDAPKSDGKAHSTQRNNADTTGDDGRDADEGGSAAMASAGDKGAGEGGTGANGKTKTTSGKQRMTRLRLQGLVQGCRKSLSFQRIVRRLSHTPISTRVGREVELVSTQHHDSVSVLARCLPYVVPNVLLKRRDELIPLMLLVIRKHDDAGVRDALTHSMFNLMKRPNEAQRQVIMNGCLALVKAVGSERTVEELLPQCWEQIGHKYEERRVLVADSCGVLSPFVPADLRPSLLFSILQQLVDDNSDMVRASVAKNLGVLVAALETGDKYAAIVRVALKLMVDASDAVRDVVTSILLPSLAQWGSECDQLEQQYFSAGLFAQIDDVIKACGDDARYGVAETDRLCALIEAARLAVPALWCTVVRTSPFSGISGDTGGGEDGSGGATGVDGEEELARALETTVEAADAEAKAEALAFASGQPAKSATMKDESDALTVAAAAVAVPTATENDETILDNPFAGDAASDDEDTSAAPLTTVPAPSASTSSTAKSPPASATAAEGAQKNTSARRNAAAGLLTCSVILGSDARVDMARANFDSYLDLYEHDEAAAAAAAAASASEATEGTDEGNEEGVAASHKRDEGWPAFNWLVHEFLPHLLSIVGSVDAANVAVVEELETLVLTVCRQFGDRFTRLCVRPLFERVLAMRQGEGEGGERVLTLRGRVLPCFVVGVLAAEGYEAAHEETLAFVRATLVKMCAGVDDWQAAQVPLVQRAVEQLYTSSSRQYVDQVVHAAWEFVVNSDAVLRGATVELLQRAVPFLDGDVVSRRVVPALVTLATDAEALVRSSSISAFGAIAASTKTSVQVQEKIKMQFQAFLDDTNRDITAEVVRTFCEMIPRADPSLRDRFILPQLLSLSRSLAKLDSVERLEERRVVLEPLLTAFSAIIVCFVEEDMLAEYVVPALQVLLEHESLLEKRAQAESMLADCEARIESRNNLSLQGDDGGKMRKKLMSKFRHTSAQKGDEEKRSMRDMFKRNRKSAATGATPETDDKEK